MNPRPKLDERRIIGLVWRCLDTSPDEKPTIGRIGSLIGASERQVRRDWRMRRVATGCHSMRELVTFGCLEYAWVRIRDDVKCLAAARLAGFHSYWNFNRQTKRYGSGTARTCRILPPLQISERDVADAMAELDTELAEAKILSTQERRRRRGDR